MMSRKRPSRAAKKFIQFDDDCIKHDKSLTNFLMSVNGVQKCVMLTMYKKLQHNSEEHLQLMLKLLKLPSKYKSKTDLLIRITSYISKP